MKLVHRPGLGLCREFLFGSCPGIVKKMGIAVVLQVLFGIPPAIGEKYIGTAFVLPKLQVGAAFKIPDERLPGFKECPKGGYLLGTEFHFDYADDHSKNTLTV